MNKKALTTMALVTLLFFSFACAFITILLVFRDALESIILWGSITVVVAAIVGGFILLWYFIRNNKRVVNLSLEIQRESLAIKKAERKAAERNAEYVAVTTSDGGIYIRETNHNVKWVARHLYPKVYGNGENEDVSDAEDRRWQIWHGPRTKVVQQLLESGEQKPQLDLMAIMTQSTQCYSIIAGQQVGKTYIADKIASYWAMQALSNLMIEKPVIIGPKWDIGEWEGCNKVGGKYDYGKVLAGLNAVKKLAESRHADEKLSHKQHPVQPIFIDDWTHIRRELGSIAEDFVNEATILYASVNIILYFILHADTSGAYGTDKIGAALHQNFYKLFIEPGYDNAGLIDRSKNVGWLQRPGQSKKDRQQVPLFTQTGRQAMPIRTAEPDLVIPPTKITQREQKIMALHQAGLSDNEIAKEVYVGHGGNQVNRVREVIDKFALHIKP